MSKPINPKYLGENGIHRVPLWRIGGFALNNTATNLYMFLMNYVSFYLMGWVGVGMVLASSFSMIMRLWDGVTDPIVGFMVDKTNGKFGKNRPFMVIGNIILCVTSFILFHVTHKLPEGPIRLVFFIIMSAIYYIGYTSQCVVTKSAQSCITNDPKQRPLFASFDGVYNTVLFAGIAIVAANMAAKHQAVGGYSSTEYFHDLWLFVAILSGIFTTIAVISIAPKDRSEFFGTGKAVKVGLKDYWEVLKNNRAIQMLVLSASSDKLAATAKTSAVTVAMFACIAGSTKLQGNITAMTTVPSCIITFLSISIIATKLGQRKAMIIGSVGGIITNALMFCLWVFGDPTTMTNDPAAGTVAFSFFTIAYLVGTCVQAGFQGISGNIVIPMTADCADYETYRSGKYVPGLMGTLFSFVDKIISSFAPMIAGLVFTAVGFADHNPVEGDPVTTELVIGVAFLAYGLIILGLLCNLIAMKYYPLTKEKMAEIQDKVAAIKAAAAQEA
ncbi:MAG: MFS transporter [Oscillospiraceae bacterium]|nr:MFS transporter [Oscillospiraceae bacterium]MBQ7129620.1 MFS transporter [Oscillospiraceae bacterium]